MVAKFFEGAKVRADAKTTAYAAYAPLDRHIHVTSSNKKISVGEYCVFHVKTNKASLSDLKSEWGEISLKIDHIIGQILDLFTKNKGCKKCMRI